MCGWIESWYITQLSVQAVVSLQAGLQQADRATQPYPWCTRQVREERCTLSLLSSSSRVRRGVSVGRLQYMGLRSHRQP